MPNIHGELQLKRLAFELRFHPSLKYYDEINKIGEILNQIYPQWRRDWTKIQFTDSTKRSSLFIGHNRIGSQMDVPEGFKNFKLSVLNGVKTYNERVPINDIRRVGVRTLWLCPVDFTFDQLLDIIQDKFYAPKKELSEVIGNQFIDVAYVFYFKKDGYNIHLQMGPVKKEEIPRWIPPMGSIDEETENSKNIRPKSNLSGSILNQEATLQKPVEETTHPIYPEVSVFYDLDCYTEDMKFSNIEDFLDKGYAVARLIINGITKYLTGV